MIRTLRDLWHWERGTLLAFAGVALALCTLAFLAGRGCASEPTAPSGQAVIDSAREDAAADVDASAGRIDSTASGASDRARSAADSARSPIPGSTQTPEEALCGYDPSAC